MSTLPAVPTPTGLPVVVQPTPAPVVEKHVLEIKCPPGVDFQAHAEAAGLKTLDVATAIKQAEERPQDFIKVSLKEGKQVLWYDRDRALEIATNKLKITSPADDNSKIKAFCDLIIAHGRAPEGLNGLKDIIAVQSQLLRTVNDSTVNRQVEEKKGLGKFGQLKEGVNKNLLDKAAREVLLESQRLKKPEISSDHSKTFAKLEEYKQKLDAYKALLQASLANPKDPEITRVNNLSVFLDKEIQGWKTYFTAPIHAIYKEIERVDKDLKTALTNFEAQAQKKDVHAGQTLFQAYLLNKERENNVKTLESMFTEVGKINEERAKTGQTGPIASNLVVLDTSKHDIELVKLEGEQSKQRLEGHAGNVGLTADQVPIEKDLRDGKVHDSMFKRESTIRNEIRDIMATLAVLALVAKNENAQASFVTILNKLKTVEKGKYENIVFPDKSDPLRFAMEPLIGFE